ncbi:MAG: ATP-binding protein [Candidatus Marinimicrobia bacterium]|nr:ATP-binding protein [Candidatus Neomarinimicrobiota bacterium]
MYQLEKGSRKLKIIASASYTSLEKMCFEVEKFSKEIQFENRKFAMMICLREALTNAIRHGCKNDDQKNISLAVSYEKQNLEFVIEDEGEGFDWHVVKKSPSAQLTTSGRGIDIIKIYSDEYEFNKSGNQIRISIKNE